MSDTRHRPHPYMVIHNLRRFLALLIIPLVRGFVTALGGGFAAWLSGAWADILVLSLIFSLSLLQWVFCFYSCDRKGLYFARGVLIRKRMFIPMEKISTLSVVRPFYLRWLHVVRLRADTLAGPSDQEDFSLFVSQGESERILGVRKKELEEGRLTRQYRPRSLYVAALAAFSSSSFAGVFFLSTLISQTGQLLGNEFRDRLYGTFEHITQLLAFGLPPAAAALGYLLLFGWLIAFTVNFIRHKNFCLRRRADSVQVSGGIFTNRDYSVSVDQINYLDIRQSVLSFLLRFCSVHISAVGYAKRKEDVSSVVPAVRTRDVGKTLGMFFPEFVAQPRQVWHNPGALFKFIGDPSWGCVLIPLATLLLRWLFPDWGSFIGWVGFMLCFPAYWFLIVRLIDYFSAGIARDGDHFTLHYSEGYYLHTVVIPRSRIAYVCLRQSPIQSLDKKCDLLIYSYSEKKHRHHIRNLDRQTAVELFDLCPES